MTQAAFRKLDKSLRHQRIVDTAVELFRKKGYRATTLDDVAGELGITKAALYHYVKSKEELLFTIYNQAVVAIFEQTERIAALDVSPEERLRLIIRNQVENIIIGNQSLVYVFFAEYNQLPAKYHRWVRQQKRRYDEMVQKIISEGIEASRLEPHDARLLTYAIVGMINWAYQWYRPNLPYTPREIADLFIDVLERGYLADKTVRREFPRAVADAHAKSASGSEPVLSRMKILARELDEIIDGMEADRP